MNNNNVKNIINNILSNSRASNTYYDLVQDITKYKNGEEVDWISGKKSDRELRDILVKYSKKVSEYENFCNLFRNEIGNLDKESSNTALNRLYLELVGENELIKNNSVRNDMYKDLYNSEKNLSNSLEQINKLLTKNQGVTIKFNKEANTILGEYLDDIGLNVEDIVEGLSNDAQEKGENQLAKNGLDLEKIAASRRINNQITYNQAKNINNDTKLIDIKIIQPSSVGNYKSDEIFKDVYGKFNKLQQMHRDDKLPQMRETDYNNLINEMIEIINLYQQIQLLQTTKEAFKDTDAKKYDESINTIINNTHKEIEKRYNKISKYINKVDLENMLGKTVEQPEQQQNIQKDNIENSQQIENNKVEKKEEFQSKTSSKVDDISVLDNYRQQIIASEQNEDLKNKRNTLLAKYEEFRSMKPGQSNIPFADYLKVYYPNEVEIIKSEEIREKQAQHVYQLWQKSGRNMDFGYYASKVQGVEINHPEDYIKSSDVINYDSYNNDTVSYVETKNNNIKEAKERYNKKSALWRLFHKKMNPEKLNFDTMTNEEIENLYTGRSR